MSRKTGAIFAQNLRDKHVGFLDSFLYELRFVYNLSLLSYVLVFMVVDFKFFNVYHACVGEYLEMCPSPLVDATLDRVS